MPPNFEAMAQAINTSLTLSLNQFLTNVGDIIGRTVQDVDSQVRGLRNVVTQQSSAAKSPIGVNLKNSGGLHNQQHQAHPRTREISSSDRPFPSPTSKQSSDGSEVGFEADDEREETSPPKRVTFPKKREATTNSFAVRRHPGAGWMGCG